MGWKLFKKKSKKNLTSPEQPSSRKTLPKPAAPTRTPSDATTVQGSVTLTEESDSLRSIGGASSHHQAIRNDSQPTLNAIPQAPDEFQDSFNKNEAPQPPRKHNIVDLDESIGDEDDSEFMTTDQGVFDALGNDDHHSDDNTELTNNEHQMLMDTEDDQQQQQQQAVQEDDFSTGDQPQEYDAMEEDQGVFDALGGEDEQDVTPNVQMSTEEAAEYYGYGDAAPSSSHDYDDEEVNVQDTEKLSEEHEVTESGMSEADAAAYYDYGEGAPSSHDFIDEEEEDEPKAFEPKIILPYGYGAGSDGTGGSLDGESIEDTAPKAFEPKIILPYGHDAGSDGTGGSLDGGSIEETAALYGYGDGAPDSHEKADGEDDAAKYGYGDAAPTVGAPTEGENQSDGPAQNPSVTPASSEPAVKQPEEPVNLYQAKRLRLKQRRISMTTVQQRTERAAARRNKLLLKKLLKKEMSEEDDYIQTHLGCDDKGMCLRHPNMTIAGKIKEFRFQSVFSCKICHSEQKAGGIARQRKSMCMVIGDIKQMQKDRKSWRERTKVMHHGKEYDSDEDDDSHQGSSDSSQSLDSLEKITGFFAEDADENELSRRDDAWKEKVSGRVAQVRAWDGKAALKCNPVFAKYFRMVSLGVPKDAVKQACEFDGWDPRVMDLDPNRPLLDQLYSTRVWKKSEKEDLLLNIRLCMGQESSDEQAGDTLLEITDNVFDAYCKKKESIELHRKQMKREEEAQKWIGSGQSLLKKTSLRRVDKPKDEPKEKKEEPKEAEAPPVELKQFKESEAELEHEPEEKETEAMVPEFQSQELGQIEEVTERDEDESESNFDGDYPIVPQPATEPEEPLVEEAEAGLFSSDDESMEEFILPLDGAGKIKDAPTEKSKSIDSTDVYSVAGDGTTDDEATDDEADFTEPLEDGGKARDKPMERNKSIDSSGVYSVADDGTTDDEADFTEPLEDGGKARDKPMEKNKSIDSSGVYSEGTTDDEADFTEPLEDGGKARDKPMERNKSIDSSGRYSVAGDESTQEEVDEDVLKMAFESNESLPSIGEIFDEWDDPAGVIEGPIGQDGVVHEAEDMEEGAVEESKDMENAIGVVEGPMDEDGVVQEPEDAEEGAVEEAKEVENTIEEAKEVENTIEEKDNVEDGVVDQQDNDNEGVFEGPIEIPPIEKPSVEDDNMSTYSDMTGDSFKKSRRATRRKQKKEMEIAHRSLEKKDIIIASLVAKVERLRKQVADQHNNGKHDARSLAEELRDTKRLIAEKDIIATGLEKQITRQERQAQEQWRIVEEQTLQIMRLKEQVGPEDDAIGPDSKKESSSSRSKSKSSSSSKKKKSSSSSKDKKRSSKDHKSRSKSSKSSKTAKRKENLDREHLRQVFKKTVRKLIIILRSFLYSEPVDKEMAMDRKSFRRSSMKMDSWVPPTEWNDFLTDDEDDGKQPSPRPVMHKSMSMEPKRARPEMMKQQRGAASVLLTKKDRTSQQTLTWRDDDEICKVYFVDRIPADSKKELFYNGDDIQRFRLDKFMEDHEDEFELVEEDDSDYSEEWIEEEYSLGEEDEIEYIDEEVISDEESYFEEEVVSGDEYEIEEVTPAQTTRRRSLF